MSYRKSEIVFKFMLWSINDRHKKCSGKNWTVFHMKKDRRSFLSLPNYRFINWFESNSIKVLLRTNDMIICFQMWKSVSVRKINNNWNERVVISNVYFNFVCNFCLKVTHIEIEAFRFNLFSSTKISNTKNNIRFCFGLITKIKLEDWKKIENCFSSFEILSQF